MTKAHISLDWDKYVAMVHYVCHSVANNPSILGKVKLQKILWNSDRESYLRFGSPISGAAYVKMPNGPAAPKLDLALKQLESEKKIEISQIKKGPHSQYVFLSRSQPSQSTLSADQREIVDRWISEITPKTAIQASDDSHDLTWKIYELGDTISYESAFIPNIGDLDPDQFNEAKEAILRAGAAGGAW